MVGFSDVIKIVQRVYKAVGDTWDEVKDVGDLVDTVKGYVDTIDWDDIGDSLTWLEDIWDLVTDVYVDTQALVVNVGSLLTMLWSRTTGWTEFVTDLFEKIGSIFNYTYLTNVVTWLETNVRTNMLNITNIAKVKPLGDKVMQQGLLFLFDKIGVVKE